MYLYLSIYLVESMSKLLLTLDQAVKADLQSVSESVLDKTYMGQAGRIKLHNIENDHQLFLL